MIRIQEQWYPLVYIYLFLEVMSDQAGIEVIGWHLQRKRNSWGRIGIVYIDMIQLQRNTQVGKHFQLTRRNNFLLGMWYTRYRLRTLLDYSRLSHSLWHLPYFEFLEDRMGMDRFHPLGMDM